MPRTRASSVIAIILATIFGACSLWRISEQDIYWQIRAGDDLFRTRAFPHVDTWSFSVAGEPWINIQWLSTLLFRAIYACGGDAALIVARGVVVAVLFAIIGLTIARAPRADSESAPVSRWLRCGAVTVFLPLAYLATSARLQLRSDTLVFIVAAWLAWLWSSDTAPASRRWWTLGLIVLAANLHAGTAPFIVAQAIAYFVSAAQSNRERLCWSTAAVLAFVITPYHVTALPLLWAHVDYAHHNMLPNPDHVPFDPTALRTPEGLFVGLGWFALCGASIIAFARTAASRNALPSAYRQLFVTTTVWLVFAALSINRARAIPYHVIFMLPLIAASLPLWPISRMAYVLSSMATATCAVFCIDSTRYRWGFGVDEGLFPVGSARFIAATHPRGNLLNTFAYGAYTVWHLRDYPTYVDTRESPFWRLQPEILAAYHSPVETQGLVRRYGVNTLLMPIPKTRYVPDLGFEDVLANYLPQQDWALVYFDRLSTVMVRRTPQDAALIGTHEYTVLRPNLPANLYPLTGPRTPERDARFVAEVDRCLGDEPAQAYCLMAKAVWNRVGSTAPNPETAVTLLERARMSVAPGSTQFATLMVELEIAYRNAQRHQDADAIAAVMGPGATIVRAP